MSDPLVAVSDILVDNTSTDSHPPPLQLLDQNNLTQDPLQKSLQGKPSQQNNIQLLPNQQKEQLERSNQQHNVSKNINEQNHHTSNDSIYPFEAHGRNFLLNQINATQSDTLQTLYTSLERANEKKHFIGEQSLAILDRFDRSDIKTDELYTLHSDVYALYCFFVTQCGLLSNVVDHSMSFDEYCNLRTKALLLGSTDGNYTLTSDLLPLKNIDTTATNFTSLNTSSITTGSNSDTSVDSIHTTVELSTDNYNDVLSFFLANKLYSAHLSHLHDSSMQQKSQQQQLQQYQHQQQQVPNLQQNDFYSAASSQQQPQLSSSSSSSSSSSPSSSSPLLISQPQQPQSYFESIRSYLQNTGTETYKYLSYNTHVLNSYLWSKNNTQQQNESPSLHPVDSDGNLLLLPESLSHSASLGLSDNERSSASSSSSSSSSNHDFLSSSLLSSNISSSSATSSTASLSFTPSFTPSLPLPFPYSRTQTHISLLSGNLSTNLLLSPSSLLPTIPHAFAQWPIESISPLQFHRVMCLFSFSFLKAVLSRVISQLVEILATTREYNTFWKQYINLPWYYDIRRIYSNARHNVLCLSRFEAQLTTTIGDIYLLLALLTNIQTIGGTPYEDGYCMYDYRLLPAQHPYWLQQYAMLYKLLALRNTYNILSNQSNNHSINNDDDNTIYNNDYNKNYCNEQQKLHSNIFTFNNCRDMPMDLDIIIEQLHNMIVSRLCFPSFHEAATFFNNNKLLLAENSQTLQTQQMSSTSPLLASSQHHYSSSSSSSSSSQHNFIPTNEIQNNQNTQNNHNHHNNITSQLPVSLFSSLPYSPHDNMCYITSNDHQLQTIPTISSFKPALKTAACSSKNLSTIWRNPIELGHNSIMVSAILHLCTILHPYYEHKLLHLSFQYLFTPGTAHPLHCMMLLHHIDMIIDNSTTLTKILRQYQPISHVVRHLPTYCFVGAGLVGATRWAYYNQNYVNKMVNDGKLASQAFLQEHLQEPLQTIYHKVFQAFFNDRKEKEMDLKLLREDLSLMLRNYGTAHAQEIAKIEGIDKEKFLKTLPQRAQKGDMTLIMGKHSRDISEPWQSITNGSLLQSSLIQVHKLFMDGQESMLEIDHVVEQNQLNFEFFAIMPVFLLASTTVWTINLFLHKIFWRNQNPQVLLNNIRFVMHKIELLLIHQQPSQHGDIVYTPMSSSVASSSSTTTASSTTAATTTLTTVSTNSSSSFLQPLTGLLTSFISSFACPTKIEDFYPVDSTFTESDNNDSDDDDGYSIDYNAKYYNGKSLLDTLSLSQFESQLFLQMKENKPFHNNHMPTSSLSGPSSSSISTTSAASSTSSSSSSSALTTTDYISSIIHSNSTPSVTATAETTIINAYSNHHLYLASLFRQQWERIFQAQLLSLPMVTPRSYDNTSYDQLPALSSALSTLSSSGYHGSAASGLSTSGIDLSSPELQSSLLTSPQHGQSYIHQTPKIKNDGHLLSNSTILSSPSGLSSSTVSLASSATTTTAAAAAAAAAIQEAGKQKITKMQSSSSKIGQSPSFIPSSTLFMPQSYQYMTLQPGMTLFPFPLNHFNQHQIKNSNFFVDQYNNELEVAYYPSSSTIDMNQSPKSVYVPPPSSSSSLSSSSSTSFLSPTITPTSTLSTPIYTSTRYNSPLITPISIHNLMHPSDKNNSLSQSNRSLSMIFHHATPSYNNYSDNLIQNNDMIESNTNSINSIENTSPNYNNSTGIIGNSLSDSSFNTNIQHEGSSTQSAGKTSKNHFWITNILSYLPFVNIFSSHSSTQHGTQHGTQQQQQQYQQSFMSPLASLSTATATAISMNKSLPQYIQTVSSSGGHLFPTTQHNAVSTIPTIPTTATISTSAFGQNEQDLSRFIPDLDRSLSVVATNDYSHSFSRHAIYPSSSPSSLLLPTSKQNDAALLPLHSDYSSTTKTPTPSSRVSTSYHSLLNNNNNNNNNTTTDNTTTTAATNNNNDKQSLSSIAEKIFSPSNVDNIEPTQLIMPSNDTYYDEYDPSSSSSSLIFPLSSHTSILTERQNLSLQDKNNFEEIHDNASNGLLLAPSTYIPSYTLLQNVINMSNTLISNGISTSHELLVAMQTNKPCKPNSNDELLLHHTLHTLSSLHSTTNVVPPNIINNNDVISLQRETNHAISSFCQGTFKNICSGDPYSRCCETCYLYLDTHFIDFRLYQPYLPLHVVRSSIIHAEMKRNYAAIIAAKQLETINSPTSGTNTGAGAGVGAGAGSKTSVPGASGATKTASTSAATTTSPITSKALPMQYALQHLGSNVFRTQWLTSLGLNETTIKAYLEHEYSFATSCTATVAANTQDANANIALSTNITHHTDDSFSHYNLYRPCDFLVRADNEVHPLIFATSQQLPSQSQQQQHQLSQSHANDDDFIRPSQQSFITNQELNHQYAQTVLDSYVQLSNNPNDSLLYYNIMLQQSKTLTPTTTTTTTTSTMPTTTGAATHHPPPLSISSAALGSTTTLPPSLSSLSTTTTTTTQLSSVPLKDFINPYHVYPLIMLHIDSCSPSSVGRNTTRLQPITKDVLTSLQKSLNYVTPKQQKQLLCDALYTITQTIPHNLQQLNTFQLSANSQCIFGQIFFPLDLFIQNPTTYSATISSQTLQLLNDAYTIATTGNYLTTKSFAQRFGKTNTPSTPTALALSPSHSHHAANIQQKQHMSKPHKKLSLSASSSSSLSSVGHHHHQSQLSAAAAAAAAVAHQSPQQHTTNHVYPIDISHARNNINVSPNHTMTYFGLGDNHYIPVFGVGTLSLSTPLFLQRLEAISSFIYHQQQIHFIQNYRHYSLAMLTKEKYQKMHNKINDDNDDTVHTDLYFNNNNNNHISDDDDDGIDDNITHNNNIKNLTLSTKTLKPKSKSINVTTADDVKFPIHLQKLYLFSKAIIKNSHCDAAVYIQNLKKSNNYSSNIYNASNNNNSNNNNEYAGSRIILPTSSSSSHLPLMPHSIGYLILYVHTLSSLIERLPVWILSQPVKNTLISTIKQLIISNLSVPQKLAIVEHIYRAFDIFTYHCHL